MYNLSRMAGGYRRDPTKTQYIEQIYRLICKTRSIITYGMEF